MPLRFPRQARVTLAIGLAFAWTALGSVPALADQVRNQEWWLSALHVSQAQKTTKGSGVTIALLDTGVDPAQPDIAGSVITGPDYTKSGRTEGGSFFGIHGTAMASLIVGHGHGTGGKDGILGVAPKARLLSVRVVLDGGDPLLSDSAITSALPSAIASGIRYAVANGAQVIDLPLDPGQSLSNLVAPTSAATPSPAMEAAAGGSSAEQSAVAFALRKGVVLVAPGGDNGAGNDDVNFPASYPGVISVGSFDSSFTKSSFTSHQPYVTLTAAGEGMIAAVPTGYATVSSTSAASAVVTGMVALIKSQFPELTPAQVTAALTRSTVFRPAGGLTDGSGHGTADAARALAEAAVIAGPGPKRAGAGAVPSHLPTLPPKASSSGQHLVPKLERDGFVSLVVLVVLLLPITGYAAMRRRRRRDQDLDRAEQERIIPEPYAPNGDGRADQMLEYFASVPAPSQAGHGGSAGGARADARGPAMAGSGPGPGYARGASSFASASTFGDTGPVTGDDISRGMGGQATRAPLTPITRASAVRTPKVSGAPPWGLAPKPDSELPWASTPAPQGGNRRVPVPANLPAPPASSVWDTAATGDAPMPAAELDVAEDELADPSGGPIYVWNPSAPTETFPQVPDENDT